MYNKVECICLSCDNCGETFMDNHTGFSIYVDENGAHEAADNDGWYSEDGKHYCPECHTIDDDDNLILKKLPPVYEVIADFPNNNDFPKGKKIEFQPWSGSDLYWAHIVEDCQGKREWLSDYFNNYPHLFRKVR
jgi:hypothetical protein